MQTTANQIFGNSPILEQALSSSDYRHKSSKALSGKELNLHDESQKVSNYENRDEKIIYKLVEIILLNNEPIKLLYIFLSEIGNLFASHSEILFQDSSKMTNNIKYLENILCKIIVIIDKFIKMRELEKCNIDLYKITSILNNFYLPFSEIRTTYLNFYIKLIFLSITKTHFDVDFAIRKKFFSQFFEYIFDIIQNYKDYEKLINIPDDYIKLIEIIIIFLRTFSKSRLEDIYIVFKLSGIVIRKIYNQNCKNIHFMQLVMVYVLVAFICPVILS